MMTSKKDFKKSAAKVATVVHAEAAIASTVPARAAKAAKAKRKAVKATGKPAKSANEAAVAKAGKTFTKSVSAKAKTPKKTSAIAEKHLEPAKASSGTAQVLDSQIAYEGPLFRVLRDHLIEPGGRESHRDVIRHNGSVVILAVDPGKKKKDPWVVVERQYRHAAGQFLWELPAGKLDPGEKPQDGAQRELAEETGYSAKKWSPLVEYYASPGFLGEAMKVFLAEGLIAGEAHPEEDEQIDFRLVKLSELLEMIDKGKIIDGKTLTSILLYARIIGVKRPK